MTDPVDKESVNTYSISHQKLVLDVDVMGRAIRGYTEMVVYAKYQTIRALRFHGRQFKVLSAQINDDFVEHQQADPVVVRVQGTADSDMQLDGDDNIYKKAVIEAQRGGELRVLLPPSLRMESNPNKDQDPDRPYKPIYLRIDFELENPQAGLHFVLPDNDSYRGREPHMYSSGQANQARLWFPCRDVLDSRTLFSFEFTVAAAFTVVASGELTKKVLSDDERTITYCYSTSAPIAPQGVFFAVGVFEVYTHPEQRLGHVTSFCLPGKLPEVAHSTAEFAQMHAFMTDYLGIQFPFRSYKMVFVDEHPGQLISGASVSCFNTHLLYPRRIIDQETETSKQLLLGLAMQFFGHYITISAWDDFWLVHGLAGFLGLAYLRDRDYNEFRYRLALDSEIVFALDLPSKGAHALKPTKKGEGVAFGPAHPEVYNAAGLMALKAPLLLYMIERKVGLDSVKKTLASICIAAARSSPGDDDDEGEDQRTLTTKHLFEALTRASGEDVAGLFDKPWVRRPGCPHLTCGFWYNRKKTVTEFVLRQEPGFSRGNYQGPLVVRIHEFEDNVHQDFTVEDTFHTWEIQCRSKLRKARKREIVLDTQERVTVDVSRCVDSPLLWIRIDPEVDFLRKINFIQPAYMWSYQLQYERDVMGQLEAIEALQANGSAEALQALSLILNDTKMFRFVRTRAAHAIAVNASAETDYFSLDALKRFFLTFCDEDGYIKPNDFTSLSHYCLQKAVPAAISRIRGPQGLTPPECSQFVLDILKYNDNSTNNFSDCHFVAEVLGSVGFIRPHKQSDLGVIYEEINRFINADMLVPSYQNVITSAGLKALQEMYLGGHLKNLRDDDQAAEDAVHDRFRNYTRYGHYEGVRVTAYECLIRCFVTNADGISEIVNMLSSDVNMRPRVLKAAVEALCKLPDPVLRSVRDKNDVNIALCKSVWAIFKSVGPYDPNKRHTWHHLFFTLWGGSVPVCTVDKAVLNIGTIKLKLNAPAMVDDENEDVDIDDTEDESVKKARPRSKTASPARGTTPAPGQHLFDVPPATPTIRPPIRVLVKPLAPPTPPATPRAVPTPRPPPVQRAPPTPRPLAPPPPPRPIVKPPPTGAPIMLAFSLDESKRASSVRELPREPSPEIMVIDTQPPPVMTPPAPSPPMQFVPPPILPPLTVPIVPPAAPVVKEEPGSPIQTRIPNPYFNHAITTTGPHARLVAGPGAALRMFIDTAAVAPFVRFGRNEQEEEELLPPPTATHHAPPVHHAPHAHVHHPPAAAHAHHHAPHAAHPPAQREEPVGRLIFTLDHRRPVRAMFHEHGHPRPHAPPVDEEDDGAPLILRFTGMTPDDPRPTRARLVEGAPTPAPRLKIKLTGLRPSSTVDPMQLTLTSLAELTSPAPPAYNTMTVEPMRMTLTSMGDAALDDDDEPAAKRPPPLTTLDAIAVAPEAPFAVDNPTDLLDDHLITTTTADDDGLGEDVAPPLTGAEAEDGPFAARMSMHDDALDVVGEPPALQRLDEPTAMEPEPAAHAPVGIVHDQPIDQPMSEAPPLDEADPHAAITAPLAEVLAEQAAVALAEERAAAPVQAETAVPLPSIEESALAETAAPAGDVPMTDAPLLSDVAQEPSAPLQ